MKGSPAGCDRRVLFLAPTSRDGETTGALLASANIELVVCQSVDALVREVEAGAGALLLPEEAASLWRTAMLRQVLASQPPWSDLPILVLTRAGADSEATLEAVRSLGNVTLLERPVRVATLLSAVRTALRARERQHQIREHLADRTRAEESLRLADQRKDEFLATLGHELRNPLAPLLTGLQLLKVVGVQDPAAIRVRGVMERQISHLVRLVNDLLEVSRITRGQIEVQREPIDLAAVVRQAIDTSRPAMEAAGHELTVELPGEPLTVLGDAVRLTQVFANLLSNAAKYTDAGGHVWLKVRREGGQAVISVRDNGIGIAADRLTSVFDMFTQVDRSSRRAQGGLGIGLTLVRSLLHMHGGRVLARSPGLGAGSEFVVELPVLTQRATADLGLPTPRTLPPQRILVVDDNHDAGETLGALLGALGATVAVVANGRAALDTLDVFQPDVVLLDIGMPEMDGYETARRIRASAHHAVLLIALTGWGQEHDQQRSREAGFDHHVVKPPDIDRLRDLLTARWTERPPRRVAAAERAGAPTGPTPASGHS